MHPKKAYYRKKYEKTIMSVTHAALHTIRDRNEVLRNPLNPNLCSIWHLFARKKQRAKREKEKQNKHPPDFTPALHFFSAFLYFFFDSLHFFFQSWGRDRGKLVPFLALAGRDDAPQPRTATSNMADATTLRTCHSTHNITAFPSGWAAQGRSNKWLPSTTTAPKSSFRQPLHLSFMMSSFAILR